MFFNVILLAQFFHNLLIFKLLSNPLLNVGANARTKAEQKYENLSGEAGVRSMCKRVINRI